MTDADRELRYLLEDVDTGVTELDEALRTVERVRQSNWAQQDLPAALDYLIELTWSFRRSARRLAKIVRGLLPAEDDEDTDDSK